MIPLRARGRATGFTAPFLARVSAIPIPVGEFARARTARLWRDGDVEDSLGEYAAVVTNSAEAPFAASGLPLVLACPIDHLCDGDVVRLSPSGHVDTLYRKNSPHNTLFVTERCNSYCTMCSQPPRAIDDAWRVDEALALIPMIDQSTQELGISGGEPTLLGQGLARVVASCRDHLPRTSLHLLSNGRRFASERFANELGAVGHPDLMVGVPLYADVDTTHDYIVQAHGAFNETMLGLHNLAKANIPVEIRVVLHRDTVPRLFELSRFIYRNLTFSSHVAFMGLEVVGFAKANLQSLWIDPADYAGRLEEAIAFLTTVGVPVSIYNLQLCTLPESLWRFCRRSISDWKNEYADECHACRLRDECGGFFAWNLPAGRSRLLRAL